MRSPSIRPALLVLLALALATPTLVNLTEGAVSAASAGEHLAGAIIVAWVAVSVVGHMVDSYRAVAFRRHQRRHPAPR